MVNFDPATIAQIWDRNGGNPANSIDAVAVCLAESGGNPAAISPASDYGLWQINIINWGSQGLNSQNWMNPDVNARVAIRMSGNGTNWAAWCTAWADPGPNCGHGFLPHPQPGSAAGNQEARARGSLGNVAGPTATPNPATNSDRFRDSWGQVQNFHAKTILAWERNMIDFTSATGRLWK